MTKMIEFNLPIDNIGASGADISERLAGGVREACAGLGATPADVAGLWNAPGFPELTTNQLLSIWAERNAA